MNIGRGLDELVTGLLWITGLSILALISIGVYSFFDDEYESDTYIEPIRIEIETVDGVSDTTYVYKKN